MEYLGEHLLPGKIGNIFVLLSFVMALLATISYYFAAKENELSASWKKIARIAFRIHSVAVAGIMGTLIYMLYSHLFEYHYVWQHSNKQMQMKYILSCLWEGQEGSFLLWSIWHVVLGNILLYTSKNWEAPVMTIFSSVQVFLSSMLLGIYFGEYHLGSNPFTVLLRQHPDFINIPLFKTASYLEKLDGRGLNPLLQNYWMTIHPPTLFLGFASTLVPFAYAIAGLWKKRFGEWQKPALPWSFFGIMILGTGILMGGAWAYEALSFGGFWAWDPVENASLVPWLTFVGAAHVMIVYKNKNESLFSTFFLTIATFILILYSTFLTRSGILGETSVHAFTDLGMSGQLLLYLLFFLALSIFLLIKNWKYLPKKNEEEPISSREFWMFIGALVLLLSSFQIIYTTSIPVINKIFNLKMAPPSKIIDHYNAWQIPFAIITCILIAIGQYFKYQKTEMPIFIKKIASSFIASVVFAGIISYALHLSQFFYVLLLWASLFAVLANLDYIRQILKGNIKKAGSSIAHVGFSLILMGALISTGKKEIISQNTSGKSVEQLGKEFSNSTNILLELDDTLQMGPYWVTYKGKRKEDVNIYFDIDYLTKTEAGIYTPAFTLHPLVQTNPKMGNIAEPDTRHFLTKDIYTHVTYADLELISEKKEINTNEYEVPENHTISIGDSIFSSNSIIVLDSLNIHLNKSALQLPDSAIAVGACLRIIDVSKKTYFSQPVYAIRNNNIETIESLVDPLGLKFLFGKINPENGKIDISVYEKKSNKKDFIVMEAVIFPYINVLWLGCFIMIVGTLLAIKHRIKQ